MRASSGAMHSHLAPMPKRRSPWRRSSRMASQQEMRASLRSLRVFAPAKVNLFLHVGERRSDGYHNLESLVAFADVGDNLAFADSQESRLEIHGPFADGLAGDENNLVSRAAVAMSRKFGAARGA